jgi:hypothetical protein
VGERLCWSKADERLFNDFSTCITIASIRQQHNVKPRSLPIYPRIHTRITVVLAPFAPWRNGSETADGVDKTSRTNFLSFWT